MILDFKEFQEATKQVDRICALPDSADLHTELVKSSESIDKNKKREFYRHMNSLFLNIMLNRLDELGKEIEPKAHEARRQIVKIINEL